jgi:4-hydroxyphenylpyruvate dioxygenase
MSQPFTPWDNPLGIAGFAFVEYATADLGDLDHALTQLGFGIAGRDAGTQATRYRQNGIDLLVDPRPDGFGQRYARQRGVAICGFGLRVANAQAALAHALACGATRVDTGLAMNVPAIQGIGDTVIYLVDETGDVLDDRAATPPAAATGLRTIDHLSCDVQRGQLDRCIDFFARVFSFRERTVGANGHPDAQAQTRVIESPCGQVRLTLAESRADLDGQDDALDMRPAEQIRHLALQSNDLYTSVEALRARGMAFLDAPQTYYELLDSRLPGHGEDLERLASTRILVDSSTDGGVLLQIFTTTLLGGIFFELVQRKGDDGFGQGNFAALFESIELDRQREPGLSNY